MRLAAMPSATTMSAARVLRATAVALAGAPEPAILLVALVAVAVVGVWMVGSRRRRDRARVGAIEGTSASARPAPDPRPPALPASQEVPPFVPPPEPLVAAELYLEAEPDGTAEPERPPATAGVPPGRRGLPGPPDAAERVTGSGVRLREFRRSSGPPWPDDAAGLWRCEITRHVDDRSSRFRAIAAGPGTDHVREIGRTAAHEPVPEAQPIAPSAELCAAVDALASALLAAGWSPVMGGDGWYADRFVWRHSGDPPGAAVAYED
ncbi:MAG: hypothetical protein JWQ20_4330 [Conexibacter sp.]|nr:hypothetical protein [Conexibacter sp.]